MHRVRRLTHGIYLVVTVLAPLSARAADSPLALTWSAPPACPGREQVLARVAHLLGGEPETSPQHALSVQASVERRPDASWRLRLTLGDQSPARIVNAGSCDELGEAAALLIALSIDPDLEPRVAAPAASPDGATEPEPAPPPPARPEAARAAPLSGPAATNDVTFANRPHAPLELRLGAALALWTGRLPGLAPGVLARASVARKRLSVAVDFGFFPPQHAGIAGSAAGGELWLASAGPKLGYAITSGSASVVPRLGLELQWVRGTGLGVEHPSSAQALLVSVEAGAQVELALSPRWKAFAGADVSALAWRPGFVLDGVGEVYRPNRLGLRFALGAEWRAW